MALFEQLAFTKPGKHTQEEPSWAQGRGNLQETIGREQKGSSTPTTACTEPEGPAEMSQVEVREPGHHTLCPTVTGHGPP